MLLVSETVLVIVIVIVIGFTRFDGFDYDHEHRPDGLSRSTNQEFARRSDKLERWKLVSFQSTVRQFT